ncbi:DUF1748-domain-containing protein [Kickxella alabastrina]|uniref:DUF1748-domain-containing protein n=1 Tax=Kickxella alabastrina TaxID=61397 RepID=UPI002220DD45|nr:DUF1748-domain-containing protein [Kickxella alabastrina]KAI7819123.1 DUF1748-domain-containing protein [Kickxella alabastrina]KAJ1947725.1 hypothetical protein GGF37_000101 [Kickxella alabastrina]
MPFVGKLVHYSIDLVLVSTTLAGIRRSAGLTLAVDDTKGTANVAIKKYLQVGESVIDYISPILVASGYFKRDK